jgi:thioredoxin reductase
VVYRLVDPDQYRGKRVLVVGGGDSAIEAATAVVARARSVVLAHRSEGFGRAKARNRALLREMQSTGRLQVMLKTVVSEIDEAHVVMDSNGSSLRIENDAVIVCAGGELPTSLLRKIGIELETKYGTA